MNLEKQSSCCANCPHLQIQIDKLLRELTFYQCQLNRIIDEKNNHFNHIIQLKQSQPNILSSQIQMYNRDEPSTQDTQRLSTSYMRFPSIFQDQQQTSVLYQNIVSPMYDLTYAPHQLDNKVMRIQVTLKPKSKQKYCMSSSEYEPLNLQKTQSESINEIALYKLQKNQEIIGTHLFEEFFIIGPSYDDVCQVDGEASVQPKILYNYPNLDDMEISPIKSSIVNFAYPFKVHCQKQTYKYDINTMAEQILAKKFQTSNKFFNEDSFIIIMPNSIPLDNSLINATNPNNFIYCVCLRMDDFYKLENQQKNDNFIDVISTSRVFCFMTLYPFLEFFVQANSALQNSIKLQCNKIYNDQNKENIIKLDINFTLEQFKGPALAMLKELLSIQPIFKAKHKIHTTNQLLEICDIDKANIQEIKYTSLIAFSTLPLGDLIFILSALCLEENLLFFSKKVSKLTMTMQTIYALIKPFKYPHPMSFCLPVDLIKDQILQCPVPFLMGINQDYAEYKAEFNSERIKNNLIIIDLDRCKYDFDNPNSKDISNSRMKIKNQYFDKIKKEYQKLNKSKCQIKQTLSMHFSCHFKQETIYQGNQQEEEAAITIIDQFNKHFSSLMETVQSKEKENFNIRFKQTQIFRYTMDSQ